MELNKKQQRQQPRLMDLFGTDDVVIVKNTLDETYRFRYGGAVYELEPGQTTRLPGFMAWHFVKKLVSYLYRKDGKKDKANQRDYDQDDKYVQKIVVEHTKIVNPEAAKKSGGTVKLNEGGITGGGEPEQIASDNFVADDIKEDFNAATGTGDQVLSEKKYDPDDVASDDDFDRLNPASEEDKAAEDAERQAFPGVTGKDQA